MNRYFFPDPKPKTSRDKKYLQYVREHPCVACGNPRTVAAHTGRGGERIKPSDYSCIPLCATCHGEQHQIGHRSFEEKHNLDYQGIQIRLMESYIQRIAA